MAGGEVIRKKSNNMNIKISTTITFQNVTKVINLLVCSTEEINKLTDGIEPVFLEIRKEENSWSVVEILAHFHACATIWGDTIHEMLTHDFPEIEYLHPRDWQYISDFSTMPFTQSFKFYVEKREKLLSTLNNLQLEDWKRGGFIKGKKHTIYSQARRMALHEHSHLTQISSSIHST